MLRGGDKVVISFGGNSDAEEEKNRDIGNGEEKWEVERKETM